MAISFIRVHPRSSAVHSIRPASRSSPLRVFAFSIALFSAVVALAGCGARGSAGTSAGHAREPDVPIFTDVAAASGIQFRQGHGGKRPLTILEAVGSGCAFLDYDNDGWLDLFLAGQPR